jgi:hypothetical protein
MRISKRCVISLSATTETTQSAAVSLSQLRRSHIHRSSLGFTNVARGLSAILAILGERGLRLQQLPGIEPEPPVCLLETFQISHMNTLQMHGSDTHIMNQQ